MKPLKKVYLIVNTAKNIDRGLLFHLVSRLREHGCAVVTDEQNRMDGIFGGTVAFLAPSDSVPTDVDAALVLGGDGSIIDAAHRLAGCGIPLIGLNFGRIGFLAEIEIHEFALLDEVLSGHFTVERRMMLALTLTDEAGKRKGESLFLNDAVLSNGPVTKLLTFDIYANGVRMQTCLADGMIVSTPTGSTAYSLSAGGPVLEPTLDCVCLTPICPHTLNNRPVIFGGDAVIELRDIAAKGSDVYLTTDGRESFPLLPGDRVQITQASVHTKLIRVKRDGFLSVLRQKLCGE